MKRVHHPPLVTRISVLPFITQTASRTDLKKGESVSHPCDVPLENTLLFAALIYITYVIQH